MIYNNNIGTYLNIVNILFIRCILNHNALYTWSSPVIFECDNVEYDAKYVLGDARLWETE